MELIKVLAGKRSEGYVFRQLKSWKHKYVARPLRTGTIWIRIKTIAEGAGVLNFNPRMLRHFFAAEWHRSNKSLEVLRRILRHKSLAYTQVYLSRLVYFEDVQQAYDEVMNGPLVGSNPTPSRPCSDCSIVNVCKYAGTVPEYALGCRFKPTVKMEVEHATIN